MRRLVLVFLALVIACGKRGDPRPPVPVIPKATIDLVVTQRAGKLLLSWSYPALTTAGKTLGPIKRVTVYRYVEDLPVPPAGQPATAPLPPTAAQFAKLSQKAESIESANLAGASVGAKLVYEDTPILHSSSGRPLRITYAVVTEGQGARGDFSNLVTSSGAKVTIYDPTTVRLGPSGNYIRDPFQGNVIPAARVNPISAKLAGFYPSPNVPGSGPNHLQNYSKLSPGGNKYTALLGKIDTSFSARSRISFRYGQTAYFAPAGVVWGTNAAEPST